MANLTIVYIRQLTTSVHANNSALVKRVTLGRIFASLVMILVTAHQDSVLEDVLDVVSNHRPILALRQNRKFSEETQSQHF